jgi:hypothetical protein
MADQTLSDEINAIIVDAGEHIHPRGLHYACVRAGVRKPDGAIYRNTDEDYHWLKHALQPATSIFGERSSLVEVLDPIARRYNADLL